MAHPISRTLNFLKALYLGIICASFHQINDTFVHPVSKENVSLHLIWTDWTVRGAIYLCQHTVIGQIDQFLVRFRLWKTFYSLKKLKLFSDGHFSYQNVMLYSGFASGYEHPRCSLKSFWEFVRWSLTEDKALDFLESIPSVSQCSVHQHKLLHYQYHKFHLEGFQFRWLKIEGIYAVFLS